MAKKYYGDNKEFKAYNFQKLMEKNPTEFGTYEFQGQKVLLLEHPTYGDEATVIAAVPALEVAWDTGFFETDELMEPGGDYQQYFDTETQTVVSGYEVS